MKYKSQSSGELKAMANLKLIEENVYEERQSNGSNKLDNFIGIFFDSSVHK